MRQMGHQGTAVTEFERGGEQFHVIRYSTAMPCALAGLSEAERAVAELLLQGVRTDTIARRRGTTVRTTSNQIACIYRKVGVHSRLEFVAYCLRDVIG